jgi:hypothetical protein
MGDPMDCVTQARGGFGGGGAGGNGGGGGGGYSGGAGGANISPYFGGGAGGSINNGTSPLSQVGVQAGNGQVIVSW